MTVWWALVGMKEILSVRVVSGCRSSRKSLCGDDKWSWWLEACACTQSVTDASVSERSRWMYSCCMGFETFALLLANISCYLTLVSVAWFVITYSVVLPT